MNMFASNSTAGTKLDAILLCDSFLPLISNSSRLKVHSVFERACNLQTEQQQLITLQAKAMPLAPGGCVIPCSDLRRLFTSQQVLSVYNQQYLYSSDLQINLTTAKLVNLQITHPVAINRLLELTTILIDFLPASAPENGIYQILQGSSSMFPPVALTNIQAAITDLKAWLNGVALTDSDLTNCLLQMVGFGIGLTPSADDFLVGILWALDALNHPLHNQLIAVLPPLLSRTTDISNAMLANAIQGRYGAQLLALLDSLQLHNAIEQVTDYGHSSGHDMLCGIDLVLTVIFQHTS